jgi:GAF domain-containing protein
MTTVPAERVAEMFVEVADTLVDEFDLIEFLQSVTTHTSELGGAAAAGLLLADNQGRLQLMAASDERAKMLEIFQVQAHEGPCQDCFRTGTAVVNTDLSDAHAKWPLFAPHAVAAGFRSVHAFPLRLRQRVIGALNLFGNNTGRMQTGDMRVIQALADLATIGLLQERAVRRGEVVTEQLQSALNSRIVIEQAKGVLSELHTCNTDEAFELLRTYCHKHNKHMGAIARAVVADPAGVPGLAPR